MLNSKISKRHSIFHKVLHGGTCGCAALLWKCAASAKLCVVKKCRRRIRRRNKDHYDCCYCFGRRLKCRIRRSYPFCQCSLKKIKIDEDDVIMMDADFEFGVDDSHGSGGYSASVGDASNILKLSGDLDGKTADRNFYTVLSKMDRDERQIKQIPS